MATIRKRLIDYEGCQRGVTLQKIYSLCTETLTFKDDNGNTRDYFSTSFEFEDINEESPLDIQVGGTHYQTSIQPIEYIHANKLPFIEGNVVKYITRWRDKNGIEDLIKIKQYIDLLIHLEKLKNF